MSESFRKQNQHNLTVPWFFKCQIFVSIGMLFLGEILKLAEYRLAGRLMFFLGVFNIGFFLSEKDKNTESLFGGGLRGFLLCNLSAIVFFVFSWITSPFLTSFFDFYVPQFPIELKVVLIVAFFVGLGGILLFWVEKSSKK